MTAQAETASVEQIETIEVMTDDVLQALASLASGEDRYVFVPHPPLKRRTHFEIVEDDEDVTLLVEPADLVAADGVATFAPIVDPDRNEATTADVAVM
jgi:hypothetical protein